MWMVLVTSRRNMQDCIVSIFLTCLIINKSDEEGYNYPMTFSMLNQNY